MPSAPSHSSQGYAVPPGPWYCSPPSTSSSRAEFRMPVNVSRGVVLTECRGVFVSNLHPKVCRNDIEEHFRQAGRVTHTEMIVDAKTGLFKGVAIIQFVTHSEAQLAIQMFDNSHWLGRILRVRKDREESVIMQGKLSQSSDLPKNSDNPSSEPAASRSARAAPREYPLIVNGSQTR